jgi:hypothetical protein
VVFMAIQYVVGVCHVLMDVVGVCHVLMDVVGFMLMGKSIHIYENFKRN